MLHADFVMGNGRHICVFDNFYLESYDDHVYKIYFIDPSSVQNVIKNMGKRYADIKQLSKNNSSLRRSAIQFCFEDSSKIVNFHY